MTVDIINPFEGYVRNMTWEQSIKAGTGLGENFKTPRIYTGIAATTGLAQYFGGEFHELTITNADGVEVRYSECDKPIGVFPRRVEILEHIYSDALFRAGQFRSPHINIGRTNRKKFTDYINTTIEIVVAKKSLAPNQRLVTAISKLRRKPLIDKLEETFVKLINPGEKITVFGYTTDGTTANGTRNWYCLVGGLWIHSSLVQGGFVTTGLTDLTPVPVPPVVEPPVVEEPVIIPPIEEPPIIEPPKDTDTPPVKNDPVINPDNSQIGELFSRIADLLNATLAPTQRASLYKIMTNINVVALPVYSLGVVLALFIGGSAGATIGVVTGVLGLLNTGMTILTNRLAKANVNM